MGAGGVCTRTGVCARGFKFKLKCAFRFGRFAGADFVRAFGKYTLSHGSSASGFWMISSDQWQPQPPPPHEWPPEAGSDPAFCIRP